MKKSLYIMIALAFWGHLLRGPEGEQEGKTFEEKKEETQGTKTGVPGGQGAPPLGGEKQPPPSEITQPAETGKKEEPSIPKLGPTTQEGKKPEAGAGGISIINDATIEAALGTTKGLQNIPPEVLQAYFERNPEVLTKRFNADFFEALSPEQLDAYNRALFSDAVKKDSPSFIVNTTKNLLDIARQLTVPSELTATLLSKLFSILKTIGKTLGISKGASQLGPDGRGPNNGYLEMEQSFEQFERLLKEKVLTASKSLKFIANDVGQVGHTNLIIALHTCFSGVGYTGYPG